MKINNRILTFFIVFVLMFNSPTVVSAQENITLPGYANFSFENPIRLNAKGCQNILLEYITEDSLPRENTAMAISIDNGVPGDGIGYGQAAWLSKMTYKGAPKIPYVWPRIGTLKLKVCRNNWTEGTGKNKVKWLKVIAGNYDLTFFGSTMNTETNTPYNIVRETFRITFVSK
jgi:hypothetical protein